MRCVRVVISIWANSVCFLFHRCLFTCLAGTPFYHHTICPPLFISRHLHVEPAPSISYISITIFFFLVRPQTLRVSTSYAVTVVFSGTRIFSPHFGSASRLTKLIASKYIRNAAKVFAKALSNFMFVYLLCILLCVLCVCCEMRMTLEDINFRFIEDQHTYTYRYECNTLHFLRKQTHTRTHYIRDLYFLILRLCCYVCFFFLLLLDTSELRSQNCDSTGDGGASTVKFAHKSNLTD